MIQRGSLIFQVDLLLAMLLTLVLNYRMTFWGIYYVQPTIQALFNAEHNRIGKRKMGGMPLAMGQWFKGHKPKSLTLIYKLMENPNSRENDKKTITSISMITLNFYQNNNNK